MAELMCSICLYVRHRPGLDDDALAELAVLTVMNGQMVCVRHASVAQSSHSASLRAAVLMESGDEHMTLGAWQDSLAKLRATPDTGSTP